MIETDSLQVTTGVVDLPWIAPTGTPDLVSIVIPTYNRSVLLSETLDAILAQTYRPLEIIVVDDGSADETVSRVNAYRESGGEDVSIQLIQQDHGGGCAARNRGAQETTGEFIVFMDDDDIPAADFLRSRVTALQQNPEASMAYGPWKRFREQGDQYSIVDSFGFSPEPQTKPWDALLSGWNLLLQGCVLRRELVHDAGPWDTNLLKSQDLDYKARLAASAKCRLTHTADGIVYYRLHNRSISGSLSANKFDSYEEVVDQLETMTQARPDYEESRSLLADYLWFHSFWLYGKGQLSRGYRILRRAKQHDVAICRRKGLLPSLFDSVGLDMVIGPLYYFISQSKKRMGLSASPMEQMVDALPTNPSC